MARYKQQRANTLLKYGYRQNASGGYEVDPNNELGGYQSMLRGEAGQNEALQRGQAASGWGGDSGYLGAQREALDLARGGQQAQFGQALEGDLSGISQGEQDAAYSRDAALYQAELDATQQAINGQNFNPGDYTGLDTGGKTATPAPAPKLKAAKPAVHTSGKAQLLKAAAKKKKKGGR